MPTTAPPLARTDYPYPSSYILNGGGTLGPYPVRTACGLLADDTLDGPDLLAGTTSCAGAALATGCGHELRLGKFSLHPGNKLTVRSAYWQVHLLASV